MIESNSDRNVLREYLKESLLSLHRDMDVYAENCCTQEVSVCLGAITELELLWSEMLGEDAPAKAQLFRTDSVCVANDAQNYVS